MIDRWHRDPTSRDLIRVIARNFVDLGVPVRLRSDGGPQFASREFAEFTVKWGVEIVHSTPYYPQSNGRAEAAVKAMKGLILKAAPSGQLDDEAFQHGLLEWRNTPGSDGRSPAQLVFGRPMRTLVPAHRSAFAAEWQESMEECDRKVALERESVRARYDSHARPLPQLDIGADVSIQHPATKEWDRVGVVVSVGKNRDYRIKLPSGSVLWRNRRFLRPYRKPNIELPADENPPSSSEVPPVNEGQEGDPPAPRRGTRIRRKKVPADV